MKKLLRILFLTVFALNSARAVLAQSAPTPDSSPSSTLPSSDKDLLSLDLNDLMNIKVTTASKTSQPFNKVAASLYVVTSEDIRRSGAQTIPEALRLVPGVEVAQLNSGQYAVSIRGFNAGFSDKLLVLVDGRTIYNDLFGGVFWEDQQMPMADIDRIEVIRGPGTASWGANAVQGIINIITKSAKDTQGVTATAEYGDKNDKNQEQVGYGGSYGKDGYYRISAMTTNRSDGLNADGSRSQDAWIDQNASFRLDQGSEQSGKLQLSGNVFQNVNNSVGEQETFTYPWTKNYSTSYPDSGGDLAAHWEKQMSNGSTISYQADYGSNIHYVLPILVDAVKTLDLNIQDTLAVHGKHSIILGAGYRNEGSTINGLELIGTTRSSKTEETASGFVQDQITLSKTLSAQIGTKIVNANVTGWEYEPSAHLGYTPDDQHTLWASASRAVRIPTIQDEGIPLATYVGPYPISPTEIVPVTVLLHPAQHNDSEIVAAYETGYRVQATSAILVDLSAFYNQYSQLLGEQAYDPIQLSAGPPAGIIAPFSLTNIGSGHSSGGEVVSHVRFSPNWRVNFGYSYVVSHIPPSLYASLFDTPTSQTEIQSYYNLNKKTEFDSSVYFVSADPEDSVGSYTKLDLRLGYKPTTRLEVSIGGNNLLQNNDAQFGITKPLTTYQVEREFYTKIAWKY